MVGRPRENPADGSISEPVECGPSFLAIGRHPPSPMRGIGKRANASECLTLRPFQVGPHSVDVTDDAKQPDEVLAVAGGPASLPGAYLQDDRTGQRRHGHRSCAYVADIHLEQASGGQRPCTTRDLSRRGRRESREIGASTMASMSPVVRPVGRPASCSRSITI